MKLIDGLMKSIIRMTPKIEEERIEVSNILQLGVRKTLGSLLDLTKVLCSDATYMVESGIWLKILQLRSLKNLKNMLPKSFKDVRNVLEVLLAEILEILYNAKTDSISNLSQSVKKEIESCEIPFEGFITSKKHI